MIDSHVHFWQLARGDYSWIKDTRPVLNKDYLPKKYLEATMASDVVSCIAVQAAPTEAETDYLLKLSESNSWIAGVTGWVDLTAADVSDRLERISSNPKLVGVRPMAGVTQAEQWLNDPSYFIGFENLIQHNLVFEALTQPHHVNAVATIAKLCPDLRIVINHAAKPEPKHLTRWIDDIKTLADLTNTYCKVSGFTQQSLDATHHKIVFDTLLMVFGSKRLLWGSDYPVLLETVDYAQWLHLSEAFWQALSDSEALDIKSGTARTLYRL